MVPAPAAAGSGIVSTEWMLALNLLATVSGFVGLLMKFERRLTRIETHLEYLLPKSQKLKCETK